MMQQNKNRNTAVIVLTVVILLLSVLGPEQIARYKDRASLNQIIVEASDDSSEGYRYTMSSNEKLYLLAQCLEHQVQPESELSSRTRSSVQDVDYEGLLGSYAFVINRQGPSEKEITDQEIFEICNREMDHLKELGVMPESVKPVEAATSSAVLYSAIDVLEPRNNLSVWRISTTIQQNADKADRLIEAYIDADTGKIYGFYARSESTWADMKPEDMLKAWSDYLGLTGMETYTSENPLLEMASEYEKYSFPGMDEGSTIVTIGFYEGINEFFIKII